MKKTLHQFVQKKKWITLALLFPVLSTLGKAQQLVNYVTEDVESPSILDFVERQDQVKMILAADFQHFKRHRKEQEYQPALISLNGRDFKMSYGIDIRPRGKYRCLNCEMPPIKLKFSKKDLRKNGFPEWNEVKVVIPCYNGKNYQQLILKEYLTYRLYQLLTEKSYRVKMVEMQLRCTKRGKDYRLVPAFLLEHEEELAGRLQGDPLDSIGLASSSLSREDYNRMQVFQFMIGNTDWAPNTNHNMSVLRLRDGKLIPVPYDFDFSGLVNAEYALPNSMTGLPDVRFRFFMGNGKTESELQETFDLFREKREAMIEMVEDFQPLRKRHRRRMVKYIKSFFEIINDPSRVRRHFLDKDPFQVAIY